MANLRDADEIVRRMAELLNEAKQRGMTVTTEDGFKIELRNAVDGHILGVVEHSSVRDGFYWEVGP